MTKGTDVLNKLFGTPARVRIMRLFLLNNEQGFLPKDISKKTKANQSAVRKELNLLANIDFIKKKSFVTETIIKSKGKHPKISSKRKKNVGWFLNENFYKPLTEAITIMELKAQVASTTVDSVTFKQVLQSIEDGHRPLIIPTNVRDPFSFSIPPAPASTIAPGVSPSTPTLK